MVVVSPDPQEHPKSNHRQTCIPYILSIDFQSENALLQIQALHNLANLDCRDRLRALNKAIL